MQQIIYDYKKETIILPKDFPFSLYRVQGKSTSRPPLHIHNCLEINVVVEGSGRNMIEGTQYNMEQDDFYIINNLERHIAHADNNLVLIVLIFDPVFIWSGNPFDYEYLKPFFNRDIKFSNCIKNSEERSGELLEIVYEIEREWNNKTGGYRLITKALLMKLLGVLYRYYTIENNLSGDFAERRKSYDRIKEVTEYIYYHFSDDLTLDSLAKIALMNKTYFSTYFKQVMQMNVSDFIVTTRINYACTQLKNTTKNINDIAYESGFKSISHFNRIFKKISKMTPMEFRKHEVNLHSAEG